MAWQDARTIADEWVRDHLPMDLRGRKLELVTFENDDDARFFYPERSAEFHQMVTSAIARQARKRKARTTYVKITPTEYFAAIKDAGVEDDAEERLAYIEACHQVKDLA